MNAVPLPVRYPLFMSLQLLAILSPPTPCIPTVALTVLSARVVAEVALPFTGRLPVLGFAFPEQARQCIRPYRVHHGFVYGLAVRLRLLSTPPSRATQLPSTTDSQCSVR